MMIDLISPTKGLLVQIHTLCHTHNKHTIIHTWRQVSYNCRTPLFTQKKRKMMEKGKKSTRLGESERLFRSQTAGPVCFHSLFIPMRSEAPVS